MREDPVDIYLRARTELMNSILDGYDYGYSVGNYLLAKANLERHGFEYQPSHYDILCDIVAKEELDEEKRKTMTLEDGNKTLKIVFEFDSAENQTAFENAVAGAWSTDAGPHRTGNLDSEVWHGDMTEHFKTEVYAGDGTTVDSTIDHGNHNQ